MGGMTAILGGFGSRGGPIGAILGVDIGSSLCWLGGKMVREPIGETTGSWEGGETGLWLSPGGPPVPDGRTGSMTEGKILS